MQNQNTQSLTEKVRSKANDFLEYFKLQVRPSTQEEFYTLTDDAHPDLHCLVREAHGDLLPDDFRYDKIFSALAAIADCAEGELDEVRLETDIYHSDLLKWLNSNFRRVAYCDEAIEEFGLEKVDLMTIITYGQQLELDEVVASVRESLISINEDDEDTGG